MSDILKAVILGIIQGLTEFIPVSSTGHLVISGDILEFTGDFAKTFNIAIQLGSILAVVIIFKDKFREYIRPRPNLGIFPNIIHIALTTFPVLIVGFLAYPYIKQYLFTPTTVAIGLMMGSLIMLFADYYQRVKKTDIDIGYRKSVLVGLFQCLSLWPGMSRSGATISGGLFSGMAHSKASSYSFICAVPAMFAATIYELFQSSSAMCFDQILTLSVGFVISFLVGWASIVVLLRLISRVKLLPFAIYRIILAIVILSLL